MIISATASPLTRVQILARLNASAISLTQAVTITSTLTVNSDTDGTTVLGRSAVGSFPATDQAAFAHFDHQTLTNYALRQNNAGATFINTPTGGSITFRVNNSDIAVMNATTGLNFNGAIVGGSTASFAGAMTLTTASSGLTIAITTGTSLVVSSTAATCATFAGGVAVAGAASSSAALTIGQTNPLSGTTQIGCFVSMTGTTAGTTFLRGGQFSLATTASVYTVTDAVGFLALNIGKGAGSTITRATGAQIDPQSNGTNNCGLLISTALSYTGNWALLSESTNKSSFAGTLLINTTTDDGVNKLQVNGGVAVTGAFTATTSTSHVLAVRDTLGTGTASPVLYKRSTTGTPGAGFGIEIDYYLDTSTNSSQPALSIIPTWAVATHASRRCRSTFVAWDFAGARECMMVEASGTAPMIGFLGATAVARPSLAAPSGTTTRTTYDTTTVTTAQLAERVKAIIEDLRAFGLEG